jgi:predicted Zn-dependent protease
VLNVHRYNLTSTSSGQAEINGNDLVVSLYCFASMAYSSSSDQYVANTVLHENGHNLGLRHGGNVDTNYKPTTRS